VVDSERYKLCFRLSSVGDYWNSTHFALKYASFNGSTWNIETVDTSGGDTSIALDKDGNPHISYCKYSGPSVNLKYAVFNGLTWDIETVDNTGSVGLETSIALDISGNPHISYEDLTNGRNLQHFLDFILPHCPQIALKRRGLRTKTTVNYTGRSLMGSSIRTIKFITRS
jgi:hypothetical protein